MKKTPRPHRNLEEHNTTKKNRDLERESYEDSQLDGLMSEGDIFFPEESEDEDE